MQENMKCGKTKIDSNKKIDKRRNLILIQLQWNFGECLHCMSKFEGDDDENELSDSMFVPITLN